MAVKDVIDSHLWWEFGIIYQVYPRSFQDSNGDGIGDLPGIISRLDYLSSLNVNAIWISPIYPSPMHDFGYDVADYTAVDPLFGTMADFDRLLSEAHRRGIHVMLDLVPNHTSDEHPWFIESRNSRSNPKRDWYIWRDPAPDGGPPNNWLSHFGGPAWTLDPKTGQYYNHQFVRQQPNLNYRNPQVVQAMLNVMRFWLDKGVDGFRVDVILLLLKDALFRDEPPNPDWNGIEPYGSLRHIYTSNLPEVHGIIRQMRAVLDEFNDAQIRVADFPLVNSNQRIRASQRMMVGETYLPNEELAKCYGQNLDEIHLPFNFQLIAMEWNARLVRQAVDAYDAALPKGAWPNWVLGNHDKPRVASRVGRAQARVANMLLLTLRGTPTTYYGEEIGMENVSVPLESVMDPPAVNQPEIAHIVGRDPIRTPMQWDSSPNSGFTAAGVTPWLPLAADYAEWSVAREDQDPTSMLSLYRALTRLRLAEPALSVGDYASVDSGADDVFAYRRTAPGADAFLVILNFGPRKHTLDLSRNARTGTIAVATDMVRSGGVDLGYLRIGPNEGLVLRLSAI